MNTMVYDDKEFKIARQDEITVAVRPHEPNRVKFLTIHENGQITVISRCIPWMHDRLKWRD